MIHKSKKIPTPVIATSKSRIIELYDVHCVHFKNNFNALLEQHEKLFDHLPKEVVYDRGGRGKKEIKGVKILTPNKPKKTDTIYQKRKKRNKFRRRAAIEPVIGHLKSQFRMERNYLHGEKSPRINALLTATAWNFKKWLKKAQKRASHFFVFFFQAFFILFYSQKTSS